MAVFDSKEQWKVMLAKQVLKISQG